MANLPKATRNTRRRWQFAAVLVASLLLVIAQPLTSGLVKLEGWSDVFFSLLIFAVLLLIFRQREHRRTALALGVAALGGVWIGHAAGGRAGLALVLAAHLLAAGFFAFALYGILRTILVEYTSGDAILGAVCGYLLLGIIWSVLYSALENASPRSFNLPQHSDSGSVAAELDRGVLTYYSFITLATVGYGDVTPITPLARTLAWIEAVTGQFYLAVLVAGLVGFKVSQNTFTNSQGGTG